MRSLILTALLVLSGCASLAAESASSIGCDESEITTSHSHIVGPGILAVNWDATCKGRVFVCSRRGGSDLSVVRCTPKI
jgi:hypothetical protein